LLFIILAINVVVAYHKAQKVDQMYF
jgi:hypothetical protein